MISRERTFFTVLLALLLYPGDNLGGAFQPVFMQPLANLTVALGRDAVFTCHIEHLGGYKVGWVKADTKAIQAIHDHVITTNSRVSVSSRDHGTWSLRIKGAQKEDEGLYMCQINTDPMKSQLGMLSIEVPPDFIPEETSGDVTVPEGWHVNLKCRANGIPQPKVSWRREDQKEIIIREPFHEKTTSSNEKFKVQKVLEYNGEELVLTKIKRDQMGVYHCIASNGRPPSISKRIIVEVHFPPVIYVPNQLVGAPLGTVVVLECFVEAFPLSINYWLNNNGEMIVSNGRHEVKVETKSPVKGGSHHAGHPNFNYKVRMLLVIKNFTKQDVGNYRCAAKNSNGDFESSIRLYDISNDVKHKPPNEPGFAESSNGEDQQQHLHQHHGRRHPDDESDSPDDSSLSSSAEIERSDNNRPQSLDNTVQGHVGSTQLSTPVTSVKSRGKRPSHQHSAAAGRCGLATTALLVTPLLLYCR